MLERMLNPKIYIRKHAFLEEQNSALYSNFVGVIIHTSVQYLHNHNNAKVYWLHSNGKLEILSVEYLRNFLNLLHGIEFNKRNAQFFAFNKRNALFRTVNNYLRNFLMLIEPYKLTRFLINIKATVLVFAHLF